METIRFGGRAVAGFGVGEAVTPMTPEEAAKVPQSPWGAVFVGVSTTLLGAVIGSFAGAAGAAAVIEPEAQFWKDADRWAATGALMGGLAGAGLGSALAINVGKKQQRAAQTLAALAPIAPAVT